ncbi:MAG TPA: hypothetical protein VMZ71_03960 [Gemmataceae bacterium]|nr:hypothetical protein [Gemmataceae bacterium]
MSSRPMPAMRFSLTIRTAPRRVSRSCATFSRVLRYCSRTKSSGVSAIGRNL